jgi:hypothetical protein
MKDKENTATLYKVDGTSQSIQPKLKKFKPEELRTLLECESIEIVGLQRKGLPNLCMIVDGEGKLVDKPKWNAEGTEIWQDYYGVTDIIAGNCIVCSPRLI